MYPQRQTVNLGESATLNCVVSGFPDMHMSWVKDGKALTHDTSNRLTKDVLRITSVQKHDRGMYQCFVSNDLEVAQGTAELRLGGMLLLLLLTCLLFTRRRVIRLNVTKKKCFNEYLRVPDTPPEFLKAFGNRTLHPDFSVSLQCIISGNPTPEIEWALDDSKLPENHRYNTGEFIDSRGDIVSHLNITRVQVEDGGEYMCKAVNRAGRIEHRARINVFGTSKVCI